MAEEQTAKAGTAARSGSDGAHLEWDWNRVLTPRIVLLMLPLVGLLVWSYWNPLIRWEKIWRRDPAWSHGFLIPLIAVMIAHMRLKEWNPRRIEPCLWGLPVILAGLVVRIIAQTLHFVFPSEVTLLVAAAGVVLLVLGWEMLRVLWVPIAYLGLMIPWEQKYYEWVALPLQKFAAISAERLLSTFGMDVTREGNVLFPRGSPPVNVAEQCSGLHLLFTFVALGVLMAYLYRRPLWERLTIIASSIPIAVLCNVIRVTLMGVSSHGLYVEHEAVASGAPTWSQRLPDAFWSLFKGDDLASRINSFYEGVMNPESFLHQSFGFAMLGLAFLLMWAEQKIIDKLFVEEEKPFSSPPAAGRRGAAG